MTFLKDSRLNRFGLGAMPLSWGYNRPIHGDETSIKLLREAYELGVNFFDTAHGYGAGHNETLVGEALKGVWDQVFVATKGGLRVANGGQGPLVKDGHPAALQQQLETSLRNLGLESIDLYYLHRVDPQVPLQESWEFLASQVKAGKIKHLGLSEVTVEEAQLAHEIHPVAAIQSELSLWTRDPIENGVLQWSKNNDVAFVSFSPVGRGYLAGTLQPGTFTELDIRAKNPRFTAEAFTRNQIILDQIKLVAEKHQATLAQIAIAWSTQYETNLFTIPGTANLDHLREDVAASKVTLDEADFAILNALPKPFGERY